MNTLNDYEITNITHSNMYRSDIRTIDKHMKLLLKNQADFICKDHINESYIRKVLNQFNMGYIYRDNNDSILGFCIWKTHIMPPKAKDDTIGSNYLHILLLCAKYPEKRLGSYMLNDVESYCIEQGIEQIRLEPLNEQLQTYYSKFGYTTYTAPFDKKIWMGKVIIPMVLKRNTQHNKTRKFRIGPSLRHTIKRIIIRPNK